MASVSGSSARNEIPSATWISASLPVLIQIPTPIPRQRQQMSAKSARLGDHAERSRSLRPRLEIGAKGRSVPDAQVEKAQTIGAAKPYTPGPRDRREAILQRPPRRPGLGETGSEYDRGAHPFGDRGLERG